MSEPQQIDAEDLLALPDPVAAWIKLDLITRCLVGRRMEQGPTPETDQALDGLMVLRAWTACRLVN